MAKLFRAAIMGPPGSGKGTISKRIADSFGLQYLSSGHFLRDSIAANTGWSQQLRLKLWWDQLIQFLIFLGTVVKITHLKKNCTQTFFKLFFQ